MIKKIFITYLFLLCALVWGTVFANAQDAKVRWLQSKPTSCNVKKKDQFLIGVVSDGKLYKCTAGVYVEVGATASDETTQAVWFSDLTGGSGIGQGGDVVINNSNAAMLGTGMLSDFGTYNAGSLFAVSLSTNAAGKMWVAPYNPSGATLAPTFKLGGGAVVFKFRFALASLSDATDNFTIRVGLQSHTQQEPDNGCFLRYNHAVNSGKWQYVVRSGGVENAFDTGVTATIDQLKTFEVRVNADGTIATFYIDGVSVGSSGAGMPTASNKLMGGVFSMIKTAGTTNKTFAHLDYYKTTLTFTTPRL